MFTDVPRCTVVLCEIWFSGSSVEAARPLTDRETVCKLGAILRIADSLDRSHESHVSDLRCTRAEGIVRIQVRSADDCENELLEADRKRELFEQAFQCELELSVRRLKT